MSVGVSEFKAKALEYLDNTYNTGQEWVLTRNGKPIAQVIPIEGASTPLSMDRQALLKRMGFGAFASLIQVSGDIADIDLSQEWEANRE